MVKLEPPEGGFRALRSRIGDRAGEVDFEAPTARLVTKPALESASQPSTRIDLH